jgi:hypothetical protein
MTVLTPAPPPPALLVQPVIHLFLLVGWGDVGYNDYTYNSPTYKSNWTHNPPRTPNLNEMAKSENSLLFWRFYAGSGVCSPTRSAVMVSHHRMEYNQLLQQLCFNLSSARLGDLQKGTASMAQSLMDTAPRKNAQAACPCRPQRSQLLRQRRRRATQRSTSANG